MKKLIRYGASQRFFDQAALYPDWRMGRVISQYKDLYKVATEEGEGLAEVSGKFRHQAADPSHYPAVGDFVMVDRHGDRDGHGVIHRVLPRASAFSRAAVGAAEQTQIVAANIDLVFVCMALNNDYNPSRLERYLSVAWSSGATPVVVLTKADLCPRLDQVMAQAGSIAAGAQVVAVSSYDPDSWRGLVDHLGEGVTASLIGSSGVGKSTLINCLAGEERLATSQTRRDDKGRHTTTRRELLLLPGGGVVIDTPGMRELGAEAVDLSQSFSDLDVLAEGCRFRDCAHETEPGCAVQAAIRDGRLTPRRLESYRKLQKEARYDGLSAREIEAEKISAMFGGMGEMKQMRDFAKGKNKRR